jgi:hypothetical protein
LETRRVHAWTEELQPQKESLAKAPRRKGERQDWDLVFEGVLGFGDQSKGRSADEEHLLSFAS